MPDEQTPPSPLYVLSYVQVMPILAAASSGESTLATSLDLGLSTVTVDLLPEGIGLPDGQRLSWRMLELIRDHQTSCFLIRDDEAQKIQFFSELTDRVYSLMPTKGAPTMLISGIPMHRIKDVEPYRDTQLKIKTLGPITGRVLDTTTGLGYTAAAAARTAYQVVTIELDPVVLEVCRLNPWSQPLFQRDNIEQRLGDAFDILDEFNDGAFGYILHDPPTFSLAGDLYSLAFYEKLYRVLAHRGRLFHYIGDLRSRSGAGVSRGVIRRLQEAGFNRVKAQPRAFGVTARK